MQQTFISLCTGHFPKEIIISTVVSLLSLAWGASRAYFIERSLDVADPDPALPMVALRVFPMMLFIVVNSLANWVAIAGMLGPWIFPALLVTFTTTYTLVRTFTRKWNKETKKEEEFFLLKTSIYALWLPSIIGDHPYSFLVSTITTLVTKILTLIVARIYAYSGLLQNINPHPTLLWCEDKWEDENVGNLTLCSFGGDITNFPNKCFDPSQEGVQKLRVCDSDESTFQVSLLCAFVLTNCLSLGASLWLNKISNYLELFKATKALLWFIPTNPVVHRSALFSVVNSTEDKDLATLREMMDVKGIETVINRPIRTGDTALHEAAKINALTKASLLIKKGADINQQNGEGNTPLHAACENNSPSVAALLLSKGAKCTSNRKDEMPTKHSS